MARRKAANGDGGLYARELKDGRTVYDVVWSYRDQTGAPRRGTRRGFRTKAEANAFRREVTRSVDTGQFVNPTSVLLGDYLARWLAGAPLKPQTLAGYQRKIRLHVTPHLGRLRLADVTAAHVNASYRRLEREGSPGGNGPLSPATVREIHNILSGAYSAAIKEGLVGTSPSPRATPPTLSRVKSARPEPRTWSAEELRRFLQVVRGDHYEPLWRLLAATGVRRGEALGLRWADVDLTRATVTVRRSLGEHRVEGQEGQAIRRLVVGPTKTDRVRVLALDEATVTGLRAHRARQAAERLRLADRWDDHDLVFCRGALWLHSRCMRGRPAPPGPRQHDLSSRRGQAGVPAIRLHDLRHTWATLALQAGIHPKIVQERLGHATIGVTLDTYSHVTPGMDREAAQLVASLFG